MKLTKRLLIGLSLLLLTVSAYGSGKVLGVADPAKVDGVISAKVIGVVATPGGGVEASAYGVAWDESADTYARTGDTSGETLSVSLSDALLPIQALMKRCVINDSGVVQYYLDASDSTLKDDGETASNLDGTDGQVMVQIPKFWYKYGYAGTTHTWEISTTEIDGYSVHPAFEKNGSTVDYRYIGAYEGIWEDNGTYKDGVGGVGGAGDKLGSVSGFAPWTDETRAQFRSYAAERGTGWRQQDFDLITAIQLLYIIEYADFYSQSVIGMGRTELSGGSWVKDSYIGVTGKSNSDGNGTNSVSNGADQGYLTDYMTYRGIENFFGNIFNFVDGININDHVPYVSNNDTHFADDTATNYTSLGVTLANANGYQQTLEQISRGFLSASVGGASNTYLTDNYFQSTGWRAVVFGGRADYGDYAGVFCIYANNISSYDSITFGSRLAF